MRNTTLFSILLLCLLTIPTALLAQGGETFTIVLISKGGEVINQSVKKRLYRRSRFDRRHRLSFSSDDTRMCLINEQRQNFICWPANSALGYRMRPARRPYGLRTSGSLNKITMLAFFAETLHVFGGELAIPVSEEAYPMDSLRFFLLQYEVGGVPTLENLPYRNDSLLIIPKSIYQKTTKQVAGNEETSYPLLVYWNGHESTAIRNIKLDFLADEQVELECNRVLEDAKEKPLDEQRERIENFIFSFYGSYDPENFSNWLSIHFPSF